MTRKQASPAPFTKAGNPTKKTRPIISRLVQSIEMGATFRISCQYAGISEATFYSWRNLYPKFDETIDNAMAKRSIRWLARIEAASEESWTAAAWKLERLYPDEYGRKTRTEVSGDQQKPVQHVHTATEADIDDVLAKMSPEARAELHAALTEANTSEDT